MRQTEKQKEIKSHRSALPMYYIPAPKRVGDFSIYMCAKFEKEDKSIESTVKCVLIGLPAMEALRRL